MTGLAGRPHRVGANYVPVYYSGGERIERFRGTRGAPSAPEDWVGSTVALPAALLAGGADPSTGVTRLTDGTPLRDAVRQDPHGWLGPQSDCLSPGQVGLLVKLLDAGERLPVHCHPSRGLARRLLGSPFGKTEGWAVLDAQAGAAVWLGFKEPLEPGDLRSLIERQDVAAMLAAMHRVPVREGDVLYVPAGTVHAIGAGVFVTELQEPTSFSVLAEYASLGLSVEQATLGLGWERALECFDLRPVGVDEARELVHRPETIVAPTGGRIERLFPAAADEFFRCFRVAGDATLDTAGYRVVVVTAGRGELRLAGSAQPVAVHAGETWLLPWALGAMTLLGVVEALVALPPEFTAAMTG